MCRGLHNLLNFYSSQNMQSTPIVMMQFHVSHNEITPISCHQFTVGMLNVKLVFYTVMFRKTDIFRNEK